MADDATELVVETQHLTKIYQNRQIALNDVSLTIEPGCVLGLLGPNGAGKTTFLRLILGLHRPTAGLGEGVRQDDDAQRGRPAPPHRLHPHEPAVPQGHDADHRTSTTSPGCSACPRTSASRSSPRSSAPSICCRTPATRSRTSPPA